MDLRDCEAGRDSSASYDYLRRCKALKRALRHALAERIAEEAKRTDDDHVAELEND